MNKSLKINSRTKQIPNGADPKLNKSLNDRKIVSEQTPQWVNSPVEQFLILIVSLQNISLQWECPVWTKHR